MSYKDMLPAEANRQLTEETIKAWRAKRVDRLAKQHEAEVLEKQEKDMKSWLIEVFRIQKFEGMMIDQRVTGLSTKELYIVEDRGAYVKYIYDNEAIDLLEFRPVQSAIRDRQEASEDVPGTSLVDTYDLFDRKA
jgi:hypothetical protein